MMRRALLILLVLAVVPAHGDRGRAEYRWFRALSIDLAGRAPTREELTAFARADFDVDAWIEQHLGGPAYAERLRRVYLDLLRLEVGPSFQFVLPSVVLRRVQILGPDGKPLFVYFRRGQRRLAIETDGDFCLTQPETGLQFPANASPTGTAKPITQAALDAATVVVKPWWLYADYKDPLPKDHLDASWAQRFPAFRLAPELAGEAEIRVCKEEAQISDYGQVYASGRSGKPPTPFPGGRLTPPPNDSGFAKTHKGRAVSCLSGTGFTNSVDCGCGIGLERCMPGATDKFDPTAFILPTHTPLGADNPLELGAQPQSAWPRFWWGQEAVHFLDDLFLEDRDFREILTGRGTLVNGPLAQFYRFFAPGTCCGAGQDLDYTSPEPLFSAGALPDALAPQDTATWMRVEDRGPHAAGILTMPVFLTKYGSRRARAHVLYSAFQCKDFVAENLQLTPSTEPNLTKRPGCATCHATLEPMAAYFTRVAESDWTYLPPRVFAPAEERCAGDPKKRPGLCKTLYDDAFAGAPLRGAYASPAHAETGPRGIAEDVTRSPQFASCVAKNVAGSFLGRPLGPEDDSLIAALTKAFVDGGYRMRPLVRALVKSDAYRRANDDAPDLWREDAGK